MAKLPDIDMYTIIVLHQHVDHLKMWIVVANDFSIVQYMSIWQILFQRALGI